MGKLLEILWVPALIGVAVLVALEGTWRHDPRHARAARIIKWVVRAGFAVLVTAIALFFAVVFVVGPIGL